MPDPRIEALTNLYQINPSSFQPDELNLLQRELTSNNIDFTPQVNPDDQDLWDTSVGAITKLFNGFVTGFTTIPVGEAPKNTTEAIFENIGHLLGFVGYVPGLGSVAKAGAMGIGTVLRGSFQAGTKAAVRAGKIATGIQKVGMQNASVPMFVANSIMKGLGKSSLVNSAGSKATRFMLKHGLPKGFIRNTSITDPAAMAYGATHLGLASAASAAPPWELEVDNRVEALMHGGVAGGVFRGLGILFPNATANLNNQDLFKNIILSAKDPKGALRLLSTSLFMGLPSTAQDAPTEMQVYQYLTGIVFGSMEMSRPQRKWLEFYNGTTTREIGPVSKDVNEILMRNAHKNFPEAWKRLEPAAKAIHKEQMKLAGLRSASDASKFVASGEYDAIMQAREDVRVKYMNGEISKDQYEKDLAQLERTLISVDLVKDFEARVEKTVTEELAKDNTKNREDLEFEHSSKIMDDILQQQADIYTDMVQILKSEHVIALGESEKQHFKVKEEYEKWRANSVDYAMDEKEGLPYSMIKPGQKFTLSTFKGKEATPEEIFKRTTEIFDVLERAVEKNRSFDQVAKELGEKYEIDLSEPTLQKDNPVYRSLAASMNLAKMNKVYDAVIDVVNGQIRSMEELGGKYTDGTDAYSYKASTFVTKMLEQNGYKNIEVLTVKRTKAGDNSHEIPIHEGLEGLERLEQIAYDNGYSLFGGVKDSPKMVLVKHLFTDQVAPESVINRFLGRGQESEPGLIKTDQLSESTISNQDRASQLRRLAASKGILSLMSNNPRAGEEAWEKFITNFANNILIMEALNKAPVDQWYGQKGFISDPTKLNKRISLLMNGFTPMEKSFFRGVIPETGFRSVFLNVINEDGSPQVINRELTEKYYKRKDGVIKAGEENIPEIGDLVERVTNSHLDGGILLRGTAFDRAALGIGSEVNVSGLKGTLTHSDEAGMMLGKYLYQRATPELNKWMEKNDVDMVVLADAIKQPGRRQFSDWLWADGELVVKNPEAKYNIPVESFSLIHAGEHRNQMGKIYENGVVVSGKDRLIPSQFISGIDHRHPETRQWLREQIETAYVGNRIENEKALDYLYNQRSTSDDINVSELGVETKIKILNAGNANKLYKRLVEDITNSAREDGMADESMIIDFDKYVAEQSAGQSAADRVMELAEVTPAIMQSTMVNAKFMKTLQSHLVKQIIRPRAEGSWVGKFHIGFGEILEKHDLQPGTVLITREVAQKKEIPWLSGKEVTIEKAFEDYTANPTPEKAELLEIVSQRVPTSSVSGIRVLRVGGIVDGMPGTAAWLHPKDLWYMDGADMDGDSAFFMPRMPKRVKKELKATSKEWEDKNGVLQSFKQENSEFKAPLTAAEQSMKENPAAMFDGETMALINKDASDANRLLGYGINIAKRLNAMVTMGKSKRGLLKPRDNKKEFDYSKGQFIQMVADAADGFRLKGMGEIERILMEKAFTPASLERYNTYLSLLEKKKLTSKQKVLKAHLEDMGAKKSYDALRVLKKLDAVISGRQFNYEAKKRLPLGLDQVLDNAWEANKVFEYIEQRTGQYGNFEVYNDPVYSPYYYAALTINKLDPKLFRPIKWLSQTFNTTTKELERSVKEDPRLLEMIDREDVVFHNVPKKIIEKQNKVPRVERASLINELISQDVGDASYFPFLRKWSEGFKLDHAKSIQQEAARLRHILNTYYQLYKSTDPKIRQRAVEAGIDLEKPIGATLRDVDFAVQKWKQGRTQAEKDLFDVFMLNPYREQLLSKKEYIAQEKVRIQKGERPKATDSDLATEWYSSDIKSLPWELPSISSHVIQDYLKFYNLVGQKSGSRKLDAQTKHMIEEMISSKVVDVEMELGQTPDEFIKSNWNPRIARLKEARDKAEISTDIDRALVNAERQVKEFLVKYPSWIPEFHAFAEGILTSRDGNLAFATPSLELATPDQIIFLGKVLEGITNGKRSIRAIKKSDYIVRTLSSIGRELVKHDPKHYKARVPILFQDATGRLQAKEQDVIMLTSTAEQVGKMFNKADVLTDGMNTEDKESYINSDLYKMHITLDEKHNGLGSELFTMAMARKEAGAWNQTEYQNRFRSIQKKLEERMRDNTTYYIPHLKQKKTAGEIMDIFHEWMTNVFTGFQEKMYNPSYENWFVNRYDGSRESGNLYTENGYPILENWAKAMEHYNGRGKGKMLGMNVVEYIKNWWLIDQYAKVSPLWLVNDIILNPRHSHLFDRQRVSDLRNRLLPADSRRGFQSIEEFTEHQHFAPLFDQLIRNVRSLPNTYERAMLEEMINSGEGVQNNPGILLNTKNASTRDHFYRRFGIDPGNHQPRRYNSDGYFPHMEHDKKIVENWIMKRVEEAVSSNQHNANTVEEMRNTMLDTRLSPEERALNSFLDQISSETPMSTDQLKEVVLNLGSAESRGQEPTPGWALHKDIPLRYAEKLNSVYYKFIASFVSEFAMRNLKRTNALGNQTKNWINFMRIYTRNQVGLSSTYPDHLVKDKELKLGNSPYYAFTDQAYMKLFDKISKKWFKKHPLTTVGRFLTEEQFNAMSQQEQRKIREMVKADFGRLTNRISQLEAKWNFLSLLTHTKTFVANITGGTMLTYANTGLHPFLKAGNFDYLNRTHFMNFKSMEEVQAFAEKHGAIEGLFKVELGLQHAWKTGKFKDAGREVLSYLKRNRYNEDAIKRLAGKTGMGDALFNSAAWFMRKSEVMLRSRSFLAHLVKHKESLNMLGLDMPNDHPWLIELANRGVQATQFLYNNANRPMFAQTSLGKIYSRFQLWAWNSIKFRRDLIRQANQFGWNPGSQEFDRLKRIMTADMFMLGLASAFPSSLFENSLAPPFSYIQDLSDFFFGDDKDRERAFYGVLPFPANILQPLSPPSSRVVYETVKLMTTGDWDKFGSRAVTWIPFGRFGQSTYRTLKSPAMAIENFTSLPVHRLNALMKKEKKRERITPGLNLLTN